MNKKKKKKLAKVARSAALRIGPEEAVAEQPQVEAPYTEGRNLLWVAVSLGILTLWAYWPSFVWMEEQWRTEPDYSHGYIVGPLALLLLYLRRDTMPAIASRVQYAGVLLLLLAIALRVVGRLVYMDFLDGWSLVPWVAGLVWIFAGRNYLVWSLPAVAFLVLLVPMPYRAESLLSFKLQGLATSLSSGLLRIFGIAAIPEGNTIWIGDRQLMVEEACSGLRIFMGMGALGYFFAVLADRHWVDRVIVLASALPLAVFVNVLRVSGTGLAYYWFSDSVAHTLHDLLGIFMVVIGAFLLFSVKSFWEHLYRPLPISFSEVASERSVATAAKHKKINPSVST